MFNIFNNAMLIVEIYEFHKFGTMTQKAAAREKMRWAKVIEGLKAKSC